MAAVLARAVPVDVIDLGSPDLIDLGSPELLDGGPNRSSWRSWRRVLAIVAVVALVTAAATAGWLYRERTAYAATPQWQAVATFLDAENANDIGRVRASTTGDVVWSMVDGSGAVTLTYAGEDYLFYQEQLFPFRAVLLGQPVVYGQTVTVPLHLSGRLGIDYDTVTVFTVRPDVGVLTVDAITVIPVD